MAEKKEDAVKKAIKEAREAAEKAGENTTGSPQNVDAEETTAEEIVTEETVTEETEAVSEQKDSEEETAEEASEGGKKLFGKDKKKKEKDKSKERIEELEDKVKRQLAEFENFRNRSEKEKSQMFDMGAKSVLEKILPVVDNFERGLQTVPQEEINNPFANGMNMVYKQMLTELEALGVKPIEAVGKEFDPNFHNAVMQVESEEYESGFVAQELLKGYTYRDTVIRHSMVAVVQ